MKKAIKKALTLKVQEVTSEFKLVTLVNGHTETTNTAKKGDFIVTGAIGEQYIIDAKKLHERYTLNEEKTLATTKPVEISFEFATENISFEASWGEQMYMKAGDALVYENGKLGYGINIDAFNKTYKIV